MAEERGDAWPKTFAEWMQTILNDERSNAFSLFVHAETVRVFNATAALHIPGVSKGTPALHVPGG